MRLLTYADPFSIGSGGARVHRRTAGRAACAVIALGLLVLSACAPASTNATTPGTIAPASGPTGTVAPVGTTATTALPHGPFAIKTSTLHLVDATRPTAAGADTPALPTRTLDTTIVEPDAPGSYPLILFSHGLGGSPAKFSKLLAAWATAGFVVAAPTFPLTNDHATAYAKNWSDVAQQPADARFVIDELLVRNEDASSPLHQRLLPDRIGAGGLSLGGATTYGLVYHDCCRDDRIKAVMVLSGGRFPLPGGDYVMDRPLPLLVMHGNKDVAMPYKLAVEAFTAVPGPAWFATLEDFTHAPPFEDTPSAFDALAEKTTTDFWVGTLGGDAAALARVPDDATAAGLSAVQTK